MRVQWLIDGNLFLKDSSVSRQDDLLWRKLRDHALLLNMETVRSAAQIAEVYQQAGLSVEDNHILTLPQAAAAFLRKNAPEKRRVMFCGSRAVRESFLAAGFEESLAPDYIVIGDRVQGTMDDFSDQLNLIEQGTQLVSLSASLKRRRGSVDVLAGGALVQMLAAASHQEPLRLDSFSSAVVPVVTGMKAGRANDMIVVSGQAETILAPASMAGMKTILVSSALSAQTDLFALPVHPDWIVQNFKDIGAAL